tara:strand:- start:2882 stop:3844 length:963 start_codon:yes stop_codon:yes gene_type:complete
MNEPVHTNNNKLPADRTAVSLDTSHKRKESEMTQKDKLTTVADLKRWLHDYGIHDDTQVAVEAPLKDVDGYVVNVTNIDYDHTSEALILVPNYDTMPEVDVNVPKATASQLVDFEKILMDIASYEHHSDECPEWYQDHILEDMHEDDPDYVKMLAWDETEWYWAWREDHGYKDSESLENVVELARDVLSNNIKGDFKITGEDGDAFGYEINNSLFGSGKWLGAYFICWHTDGVANDNYLMFEEVDDAKAYLQWMADTDALSDARYKHDSRYFPMPKAPKAKNTGDDMDPFVEFISWGKFHKVYDKRNKHMTLSELGFFPE